MSQERTFSIMKKSFTKHNLIGEKKLWLNDCCDVAMEMGVDKKPAN
uniref:Uncharacterized protein n=1 Tax=Anguilla anguilla TaxID=7936 RepID=A0A0E9TXI7_ANGAN